MLVLIILQLLLLSYNELSINNVDNDDGSSSSLLFHVEVIENPKMMRSIEECNGRIRCNEVYIFEQCDPSNHNKNNDIRSSNAISKYRRSAAGTDRHNYPIQSLNQILFN